MSLQHPSSCECASDNLLNGSTRRFAPGRGALYNSARKVLARENGLSAFDRARDELFSHILRCEVVGAEQDHQREWFDDTMEYMAERYPTLSEEELSQIRNLGEQYVQPVIQRDPEVGTTA